MRIPTLRPRSPRVFRLEGSWTGRAGTVDALGESARGELVEPRIPGLSNTAILILVLSASSCGRSGPEEVVPPPTQADLISSDVVDDMGAPGTSTSLRFDSKGQPHISYYESQRKALKYVYFGESIEGDGLWLPQTDAPILDNNGIPTGETRPVVGQEVDVSAKSGNEGMGSFNTLLLGKDDRPYIAYYDDEDKQKRLKLAWGATRDKKTGDWTFNKVFLDGKSSRVGKWLSAAMDTQGIIHVAYYDEIKFELKYVQWDPSTWDPSAGDSAPGDGETIEVIGTGNQIAIALSSPDAETGPDRVYVAYHTSADQNLRLAYRQIGERGAWNIQVLDDLPARANETPGDGNPDDVGTWVSMVIDPAGNVHLAYFDQTGKDLKYLLHDVARQKSFPRFRLIYDYNLRKVFTREEHYTYDEEGQITGTTFTDVRQPENLPVTSLARTEGVEIKREWVGLAVEDGKSVGSGFETDMALGPEGAPIISYRDAATGDLKIALRTLRPSVVLNPTSFLGFTRDVVWSIATLDTPMIRGIWSSVDTYHDAKTGGWRIGVAYEGMERVQGLSLTRRLMFALLTPSILEIY